MQIQSEQSTHTGTVRRENQDRMGNFVCPLGAVFVVADGMGGMEGGSAAATLAVESLQVRLSSASAAVDAPEVLRQAAAGVNADILSAAAGSQMSKMGTTIVVTLIQGRQLWIGHAGDSRAYLYYAGDHAGRLARLTKDHSLVQKMLDHGMLTADEAHRHPNANVITRWLGQPQGFELEVTGPVAIAEGDVLLLCTDGLSRALDDSAIEELIRVGAGARDLLDAALTRGGEDNLTAQCVRFGEDPAHATLIPRRGWIFALCILLLVAILLLGYLSWVRRSRLSAQAPSRVSITLKASIWYGETRDE